MKIPLRKLRVRRREHWFILFGLTVIIVLGVIAVRLVSAPSHGKTTTTSSTIKLKAPKANREVPTASDVHNDYFSLALPIGYRQQSASQDTPGLLYQQTIIKSSMSGSLVIAIAISSNASGLSENTAYNLRLRDPVRYKMTTQVIKGESVITANDTQFEAVAAFWVHADKLATISISSGLQNPATDNNTEEIKVERTLLAAWQWQ